MPSTNLLARLHLLLKETGLTEQKQALVHSYTAGRSESSKDLTDAEARLLNDWLATQQPDKSDEATRMDTMRKKIISMVYEMQWCDAGDWKAAIKAINAFCTGQHGKFKKVLNKHNYKELVHVTTQFNQLYMKHLNSIK